MSKSVALAMDFETGSKYAHTTQLCSVGAVAVDLIKLEIIPGTEFYSLVKPEDESKLEPEALAVNKLKVEDLRKAPSEKTVWTNFVDYVKKYKSSNSHWGNPKFIGYNHINFDLIICDRLCTKYGITDKEGIQNLYHRRDKIDMLGDIYRWLGFTDKLQSISFDTVREYMGMTTDPKVIEIMRTKFGCTDTEKLNHNAFSDAYDAAKLHIRFFKLYKELSNRIPFEGAFAGG